MDSDYLKMQKLESGDVEGFFDDGMFYFLNNGDPVKPKHVTFEVLTTDNQIEVCDVRLTTLKPVEPADPSAAGDASGDSSASGDDSGDSNQPQVKGSPKGPAGYERVQNTDVFFFRLGYYNYMKVNTESMIYKTYNNVWMKVDILIHWDEQNVSVYVDSEKMDPRGSKAMPEGAPQAQPFFVHRKSVAESTNAIGIYNLTPGGICHIRKLQVCEEFCADKDAGIIQL